MYLFCLIKELQTIQSKELEFYSRVYKFFGLILAIIKQLHGLIIYLGKLSNKHAVIIFIHSLTDSGWHASIQAVVCLLRCYPSFTKHIYREILAQQTTSSGCGLCGFPLTTHSADSEQLQNFNPLLQLVIDRPAYKSGSKIQRTFFGSIFVFGYDLLELKYFSVNALYIVQQVNQSVFYGCVLYLNLLHSKYKKKAL